MTQNHVNWLRHKNAFLSLYLIEQLTYFNRIYNLRCIVWKSLFSHSRISFAYWAASRVTVLWTFPGIMIYIFSFCIFFVNRAWQLVPIFQSFAHCYIFLWINVHAWVSCGEYVRFFKKVKNLYFYKSLKICIFINR